MTVDEVKAMVGYHNYYYTSQSGGSVFDAVELVQKRCPAGWRAGWSLHHCPGLDELPPDAPPGAIRVGQVKVHHSTPAYPLFIYPVS